MEVFKFELQNHKNMKTKILLLLILFNKNPLTAQNLLYRQTNKEIEYDYGIIDNAALNKVSEIEKIKYELKYAEKTFTKTIDQNFNTLLEITIDSNGYEKDWMNLAKKFRYDETGMLIIDKNNSIVKTIPYTTEQLNERTIRRDNIQSNGFHPGIINFPEFNAHTISQLATQNIIVQNLTNGASKVTFKDKTTTYNKPNLTITNEWTDKSGFKNKETIGYETLADNKGYLQRIKKSERFINSVNGPCITEVKLKYYLQYSIQDDGHLIDKALKVNESIQIFPNPNNGVFTANVLLSANNSIVSVRIINVLTGSSLTIDNNSQNTFTVNQPSLAAGNYVLQVVTSNTTLNTHFFKN